MRGCLLLVGSILVGLVIGLVVGEMLRAITGNEVLASALGTGVWLLSIPVILVYASLWFTAPEEIANPPEPTTTVQRWRANKAESKMEAAELRMGFVFALIGGATAEMAKGSNMTIALVTICCAAVGALIGYDVKRRVRRIRAQFTARKEAEDGR